MIKCNICNCEDFKAEFEVTRHDKFMSTLSNVSEPARYKICVQCENIYYSGSSDFEHIYHDNSYYNIDYSNLESYENRFKQIISLPDNLSDNMNRVNRIKCYYLTENKITNNTNKILDVGAGLGVFLYKFLTDEWQGTAIEPDPIMCSFLKNKLPDAEIFTGYSSDFKSSNKYNLITLNRMLEHVSDPKKIINEVSGFLKDEKSLIYLELPSTESFYKDGPNNEAFGYGHYNIYSEKSLKLLAETCDLDIKMITNLVEPSGKFTIYCFLSLK
jgi:ubiquinone/menaquinone biosynthesis C-methylase UbiE